MNQDFEEQSKHKQQGFEEGAIRLSEKLTKQKKKESKKMEVEYKAKTVEFKKAMEHGFYCIDKQKMEKEKLQKRYSELATQLKKSKFSTKQLKYFLYNL